MFQQALHLRCEEHPVVPVFDAYESTLRACREKAGASGWFCDLAAARARCPDCYKVWLRDPVNNPRQGGLARHHAMLRMQCDGGSALHGITQYECSKRLGRRGASVYEGTSKRDVEAKACKDGWVRSKHGWLCSFCQASADADRALSRLVDESDLLPWLMEFCAHQPVHDVLIRALRYAREYWLSVFLFGDGDGLRKHGCVSELGRYELAATIVAWMTDGAYEHWTVSRFGHLLPLFHPRLQKIASKLFRSSPTAPLV